MQRNFPLCLLVSILISFTFSRYFYGITDRKVFSCYCGFTISIFIGVVIKEYFIDKVIKNTIINKNNIYKDIIGSFIGAIMCYL